MGRQDIDSAMRQDIRLTSASLQEKRGAERSAVNDNKIMGFPLTELPEPDLTLVKVKKTPEGVYFVNDEDGQDVVVEKKGDVDAISKYIASGDVPERFSDMMRVVRARMAQRGVNIDSLITVVQEAAIAQKPTMNGSLMPDHAIRLKSAGMMMELFGMTGKNAEIAMREKEVEVQSKLIDPILAKKIEENPDAAIIDFMKRVKASETKDDPANVKFDLTEEDKLSIAMMSSGMLNNNDDDGEFKLTVDVAENSMSRARKLAMRKVKAEKELEEEQAAADVSRMKEELGAGLGDTELASLLAEFEED